MRSLWISPFLLALLLLAGCHPRSAAGPGGRYQLAIGNRTEMSAERVVIEFGNVKSLVGQVPAGWGADVQWPFQELPANVTLTWSMTGTAHRVTTPLAAALTNPCPGRVLILIEPDGRLSVLQPPPPAPP